MSSSKRKAGERNKKIVTRPGKSPPVRTGPVTYWESLERRKRVIEAAGKEFLKHGFHGASIDTIAEKSHVSKVTIYRECGNKETIFQEFFLTSVSTFRYGLDHILHSDSTLQEAVRAIVRLIIAANSDSQSFSLTTLAIAERERFPHVSRRILEQVLETSRTIGDFFRSKLGESQMSREEASRRAMHLLNMALGGSAVLLDDPRTFYGDHDEWVESVASTFLFGITGKAQPNAPT